MVIINRCFFQVFSLNYNNLCMAIKNLIKMTKYHIDSLLNINEVGSIINIFAKHNIELRLVGGCIRNAVLKIDISDIDFATKYCSYETIHLSRYYFNCKKVTYFKAYFMEHIKHKIQ